MLRAQEEEKDSEQKTTRNFGRGNQERTVALKLGGGLRAGWTQDGMSQTVS